jgi:hypothetical protein
MMCQRLDHFQGKDNPGFYQANEGPPQSDYGFAKG